MIDYGKMLKTSLRGHLSPSLAQQHQTRSQIHRSQTTCKPLRQAPIMCSTEKDDLIQYAPQRIIEARKLPNQAETIFNSGESVETLLSRVPVLAQSPTQRSVSDLDYLSVRKPHHLFHVTQPWAEHQPYSFIACVCAQACLSILSLQHVIHMHMILNVHRNC